MPNGWRLADGTPAGSSLPEDRTVAVGDSSLPRARLTEPLQRTVQVRSLYDGKLRSSFYVPSYEASEQSRNGQPGWMEVTNYEGGRLATYALPWLNAVVVATAPDEQTPRALVDSVEVPAPTSKWQAISSASSLELHAWFDGEGRDMPRITDPRESRGDSGRARHTRARYPPVVRLSQARVDEQLRPDRACCERRSPTGSS